MTIRHHLCLGAAALVVLPVFAGCGGGASEKPTVTAKPSKKATSPAGPSEGPGEKSDQPGEAPTGGVGTIRGRIVFEGNAPTLQPVVQAKDIKPEDAAVCKVDVIGNETLLVDENGGVENVFFYLEKAPHEGDVPPVPETKIRFDNKGCRFVPHATFLRVGQTMQITNSDPILHNTHTLPVRNQPFNSAIPVSDMTGKPYVYDKPERVPVQVKCDIHAWMSGHHLVLDHPWGAVTKKDGTFEIKDVPAGKHKFKIYHELGGYLDRGYSVTVKKGDNDLGDITIPMEKFARFDGPEPKVLTVSVP